jgi:hypothetical protein
MYSLFLDIEYVAAMNIACHEGKFEDLVFEHEHANENIVYLET